MSFSNICVQLHAHFFLRACIPASSFLLSADDASPILWDGSQICCVFPSEVKSGCMGKAGKRLDYDEEKPF